MEGAWVHELDPVEEDANSGLYRTEVVRVHKEVYQGFPNCCKLGLAVGSKAVREESEGEFDLYYKGFLGEVAFINDIRTKGGPAFHLFTPSPGCNQFILFIRLRKLVFNLSLVESERSLSLSRVLSACSK